MYKVARLLCSQRLLILPKEKHQFIVVTKESVTSTRFSWTSILLMMLEECLQIQQNHRCKRRMEWICLLWTGNQLKESMTGLTSILRKDLTFLRNLSTTSRKNMRILGLCLMLQFHLLSKILLTQNLLIQIAQLLNKFLIKIKKVYCFCS